MEINKTQQESTMTTEPQKEHQWLQKLVGEWTYEADATTEPGKIPEKVKGTESVRSLGGLWILAEGQGEMSGGAAATTIMTLGYDPQKKRYVGTWIGSMMTHLWVYDGTLDAAESVLTLDAEGPHMAAEGKMAKYKDVIEFKSDNHLALTSHMLGDDGTWRGFMTANLSAEEIAVRSNANSKRPSVVLRTSVSIFAPRPTSRSTTEAPHGERRAQPAPLFSPGDAPLKLRLDRHRASPDGTVDIVYSSTSGAAPMPKASDLPWPGTVANRANVRF